MHHSGPLEPLQPMLSTTITPPPPPLPQKARFWVQVMRDLRYGVKLKKVQERQYNLLPIEYQLTPYEMLMDDIRSKRYKLRKVMVSVRPGELRRDQPESEPFLAALQVNGDIPPRLKKSAHEIILEFIRSRPPLNPVSCCSPPPPPQKKAPGSAGTVSCVLSLGRGS